MNPKLKLIFKQAALYLEKSYRTRRTRIVIVLLTKENKGEFELIVFPFQRLQAKKVNMLLRGEQGYLHEPWLTKSVPVYMERIERI